MKYPDDFEDYDAKDPSDEHINNLLQMFLKTKPEHTQSGNIIIIADRTDFKEVYICKIEKVAKLESGTSD